MPNTTVPAAATGLPPSIFAFPSERARPPAPSNGLLDRASWDRMWVADMIVDQGADSVARILDENAASVSALRGVVASLTEADRRLAAAADRYLQQEGV